MPWAPARGILWGPMESLLLIAQATQHAPVILAQDTALSWPVVVTIMAVAVIIIESRVKIHRLERDMDKLEARLAADSAEHRKEISDLKAETIKVTGTVGAVAVTVGKIEAGVNELRKELHEEKMARASSAA